MQENTKRCRLYNIDNKDKEDNKDKVCGMHNGFLTSPSWPAADAATIAGSVPGPLQAEPLCSQVNQQPTPVIDENQIKRAMIQLFDNGATAPQRYKLKLKLNLVDDENPEFIASLTKDMRNFRKYIPQECATEILHMANELNRVIKEQYGVKPYLGKLHFNQGKGKHIHSQIEPYTLVAVYWKQEYNSWAGIVKFYDWFHEFDLFTDYINSAQQAKGLKAQELWINPQFDNRQRPKTWQQQRLERG